METQEEKCRKFRALHARESAFVIPNAWDAGSARILEVLGFEAVATTSAGFAISIARPDGARQVSREETLRNAREIVEATALPVSADLERGFGDAPEACAKTIEEAAAIGLAGGSIEDATGDPDRPIYEFSQAVERVEAAVEAARRHPFVLTARAENFLHGRPDLDDTIRRLQAFEKAGAEVLYAPGLSDLEAIATVCRSVSRPVNVVMGLKGAAYTVAQLSEAGVRRISVGGAMARAAYGAFVRAAREVRDQGTFSFAAEAIPHAEIMGFMAKR
jgi:2-methylisocitrate lyase-like PEP mutase family enzyme